MALNPTKKTVKKPRNIRLGGVKPYRSKPWIVSATLAALFLASTLGYAKNPNDFTLYLTTDATNRYGGNVMLNLGSMGVEELPEFLSRSGDDKNTEILPKAGPIEVIIVVPKGASPEARKEFVGQIRREMKKRYPTAQFTIRESFVDLKADIAALETQRAQLLKLQKQAYSDPKAVALAGQLEKVINDGIEEDRQLEKSWIRRSANKLNETHPYNTVIAARVIALTKFSVASYVLISRYGINPISLMLGALAGGISAMFGYNAKRWSEFCTTHQFPWFKDSMPVKFYNKRGWLKSATINFIRSLGLDYGLPELAYLSHQNSKGKPVESPNRLAFFAEGLGITIPEIVLDGLMDDAARALELKGVLNHQSRSYLLWGIGLIDTVMHGFFRAGAVRAAYITAAISWGTKLALWGSSKLLGPKSKRFIFISDQVSNEKTAQLIENRENFFAYLAGLGKTIIQATANKKAGRFSVSDREMIIQQLGLEESWNLALTPEQIQRIEEDSKLTQKEFAEMLNLRDTDRDVVNSLWGFRSRNLGKCFDPIAACTEALTSPQ
jgi:hypothetical protein